MTRRAALRVGIASLATMSTRLPWFRPGVSPNGEAEAAGAAARAPTQTWAQRSTAPGVVRAFSFGDYTQAALNATYLKSRDPSVQMPAEEDGRIWARRDPSLLSPGANPTLRFDWPKSPCGQVAQMDGMSGNGPNGPYVPLDCVGSSPRGIAAIPFADDWSIQFGTDSEFWVQWCQWFHPWWVGPNGQHPPTSLGGMKLISIDYGEMLKFITNGDAEIVLADMNGLVGGYHSNTKDYGVPPRSKQDPNNSRNFNSSKYADGKPSSVILLQNAIGCRYGVDLDPGSHAPSENTTSGTLRLYGGGTRQENFCNGTGYKPGWVKYKNGVSFQA